MASVVQVPLPTRRPIGRVSPVWEFDDMTLSAALLALQAVPSSAEMVPDGTLETTLLWIYVGCMAAGALVFANWMRDPRGVPWSEYVIAITIPVWSGIAYMAMALDQGRVVVQGQITHYARYADWVVTTPLLLVALALTAMHYLPKKNWALIGALVVADVIMILCGLVGDLSRYPIRYVYFAIGVAALGVIFYITWGPLLRIADSQGEELGKVYRRVAAYLTIFWIGYPLTWILGPSGIRLIGQDVDTVLFVVLPIFSKVGFSLLDLSELRRLKEPSPHAPLPGQPVLT
jgi:bacteriorhodopsin